MKKNYPEWICRLTDHFDKWTKDSTVPLKELIIMEQVLQSVDDKLAVRLRERWLRERAGIAGITLHHIASHCWHHIADNGDTSTAQELSPERTAKPGNVCSVVGE